MRSMMTITEFVKHSDETEEQFLAGFLAEFLTPGQAPTAPVIDDGFNRCRSSDYAARGLFKGWSKIRRLCFAWAIAPVRGLEIVSKLANRCSDPELAKRLTNAIAAFNDAAIRLAYIKSLVLDDAS